jgi:hypothetical protein
MAKYMGCLKTFHLCTVSQPILVAVQWANRGLQLPVALQLSIEMILLCLLKELSTFRSFLRIQSYSATMKVGDIQLAGHSCASPEKLDFC